MNRIDDIHAELKLFESWRKKNHRYSAIEAHARYVIHLEGGGDSA